ncbi:MAG: hypothetical protein WCO94_07360 [Verrucomicrobiota bacterium]
MKLLAALAIGISLAIGQSNAATQYFASENIAQFGWLDQYSMVPLGATACVPTSATNAMTFLQGANPAYFGTTLTGSNYSSWVTTTNTLMSSPYMDTTSANGTIYNHIPYALTQYIKVDCGFANVSFSGMFPADYWSETYPKPSYMTDGLPTWSFLLSALQTNQATIFSFSSGPGMGHESTAVGFSWLDANNDGIIQQSENATISFLDPLDPSTTYTGGLPDGAAKITMAQIWNAGNVAGGELNITYSQYAGSLPYTNDYGPYTGSIDTMFAIVPESQTIMLLVLSLTCLPLATRWKAARDGKARRSLRLPQNLRQVKIGLT